MVDKWIVFFSGAFKFILQGFSKIDIRDGLQDINVILSELSLYYDRVHNLFENICTLGASQCL